MLSDERRSSRQTWLAALAAVVVLAIAGGGILWWHSQNVAAQLQQQVAAAASRAEAIRTEAADALAKSIGVKPADIKRMGESTVYIYVNWQLYDRNTDKPIFHKVVKVGDEWLPAFVRLEDGRLVRWLTTDIEKLTAYNAVGGVHSGSGFVVSEQGFILTNKHVASTWAWPYSDLQDNDWTRGSVYTIKTGRAETMRNIDQVDNLRDWVPESGGYLFEATRPNPISNGERYFFGRNEVLSVQFPGTLSPINATLLRASVDADIAEIKIDAPQLLSKLDLADDNTVQLGEKVILLGYPSMSQKAFAVRTSTETGRLREHAISVQEPTVAEGVVSKLPTKTDRRDQNSGVQMVNSTGDKIQLDIFAAPGDSGGPVIDSSGKVVAIISSRRTATEHVAFAVPISHVRELLQPQRNASP
jgi:S1-C subfamily serine protease